MSPTAKSPAKNPPSPTSFEADLGELEAIIAAMEAGQMPLQEALDAYSRGATLLRRCQETLTAAEQQLCVIDASSQPPDLKPFIQDVKPEKHD